MKRYRARVRSQSTVKSVCSIMGARRVAAPRRPPQCKTKDYEAAKRFRMRTNATMPSINFILVNYHKWLIKIL